MGDHMYHSVFKFRSLIGIICFIIAVVFCTYSQAELQSKIKTTIIARGLSELQSRFHIRRMESQRIFNGKQNGMKENLPSDDPMVFYYCDFAALNVEHFDDQGYAVGASTYFDQSTNRVINCYFNPPQGFIVITPPTHGTLSFSTIPASNQPGAVCPVATVNATTVNYTWTDTATTETQDQYSVMYWYDSTCVVDTSIDEYDCDGIVYGWTDVWTEYRPQLTANTLSASSNNNALWWFNGLNPASGGFPIQDTLYVTALSASDEANWPAEYDWEIDSAGQEVTFADGNSIESSTTSSTFGILTANPSAPGLIDDVTIKAAGINYDYYGNPYDVPASPLTLTVLQPFQLVATSNPQCGPANPGGNPAGWSCLLIYKIQDQNSHDLPNFGIPYSENFSSTFALYGDVAVNFPGITVNWYTVNGTPGGSTWPAINIEDVMSVTQGFGFTYAPAPTSPVGNWPYGQQHIDWRSGGWYIGSQTPGQGVLVQTNNWREYVDHGQHSCIVSPPGGSSADCP